MEHSTQDPSEVRCLLCLEITDKLFSHVWQEHIGSRCWCGHKAFPFRVWQKHIELSGGIEAHFTESLLLGFSLDLDL
jgi:hypothetical protein